MFFSKKFKSFKTIRHCFFSRKGGFSKGLYKGLNCGKGSNDNKKHIIKNLSLVVNKMQVNLNNLILMHQTHSNKVLEVNKNNLKKKIIADAVITKEKGILLGVVTADCVPILVFDRKNGVIGCIHAGWKGAFSGILENTINKIKKLNFKSNIYASIGPCIGKRSYEVDIDFYKKFVSRSKKNKKFFSQKSKLKKLFDLRKYVTSKLLDLGVKIDQVNHDTFKEKNYFFSFRRSTILNQSDYGRCISVIRLV